MSDRYRRSEELLARAEKTIPLGTQTFSKSRTQFPHGVSPFYAARAQGSKLWDVDGNEYVDFINGLASVTLGYDDPDVTAAVRRQLEDGVIFSLPHPLETEVAELIVEMVPCAERSASARTAPTRPPARSASRAPSPAAITWRSAAITAGRTGISAAPRATAACRRRRGR